MGDLSENSKSYYDKNYWYEIFSMAEDFPKLINKFFNENIFTEKILDAGCGTGKFSNLFSNICNDYIGIDKSENQISIAKNKNNLNYIVSDLSNIPLADKNVNISICPWVLGTIEEDKRNLVIEELKRVTKDRIILIENLENSEFEKIRNHDKDKSTHAYLEYLEDKNFKLIKKLNSYFLFDNIEIAKETFRNIYNDSISNNIKSNKIEHKIGIFVLEN